MTLMPEIHDALARAVATRANRRRWWHPSRRGGLLAIGAIIVSGTAVAATTGWQPILGSPDRGTPPLAAKAGVPADQLAALAILRRPQTDADRGPLVQSALRVLTRQTINGIHTDAIRVIFHGPRQLAVLIPAERVGHPVKGVPSSKTIQRHALCLMSTSYQQARTWKFTQHGKPKTIHRPAGYPGWSMSCGGLDMLRTTGLQTGTSPQPSGGLIVNGRPAHLTINRVTLVPDGVARVTVRLRHGRSITVPVRDNVYRYTIRDSPASMGTIWFDAAGRRIDHRKRP
jgi:hypothetical protein